MVQVKTLGVLGWDHIAETEAVWNLINKPKQYALF